jgi:hypothetical protein
MKKLIFLEDKFQAEEFLSNFDNLKDFTPVSLSFESEKILKKEKKKFLMDEDYEDFKIYENIHEESLKEADEICKKIELQYRGVNIFKLFYYDLYTEISRTKFKFRILKEIIKKENPSEIFVFFSEEMASKNYALRIMKEIFDGKIITKKYFLIKDKSIRDKKIMKFVGKMQKIITKLRLNLSKNKKKIFISGGKTYFEDLVGILMKNKKNKVFNFGDILRKSFFVGKNYLPFYEFSGKKNSILQDELKENLNKIKNNLYKIKFKISKETEKIILGNTFNFISSELYRTSSLIEEFNSLVEKNKIDMVILPEEDLPLSRIIVQISKEKKIPTLIFQHGFFQNETSNFIESPFYFVFGNSSKELAEKYVSEKTQINIIGCPRYDSFYKYSSKEKKQIVYAMEVANEEVIIPNVHLTRKRQKEILRNLFQILKKFPDYKLILKIRPNWNLKELITSVSKEEHFFNFEIIEKTNNIKLLNESKLIIINHTSMGLEALLLGKPVISFSYRDLNKMNPYTKINNFKVVYSKKGFEDSLKCALKEEKTPKIDISNEIIFDDKASERANKAIEKIMKHRL